LNSPIRKDLVLGTACGLSLAGIVSALALAPPRPDAAGVSCLVLAAATGVATRARRAWPPALAALAGLIGLGAGASCLAAMTCAAAGCLRAGGRALRIVRAGLAAAVAAAAWWAIGVSSPAGPAATAIAVPAHALAWWTTLAAFNASIGLRRRSVRPRPRSGLGVLGLGLGYAAAWAWGRGQTRLVTTALIAGVLAALVVIERRQRTATGRRAKSRRRPAAATRCADRHVPEAPPAVPAPPATGPAPIPAVPALGRLDSADRDLRILDDIARAGGYGLTLDDYLTLVAGHLASIVPFASLAVYLVDPCEPLLRARFATGLAADALRLATMRVGEGLSGRAAERRLALSGTDAASGDFGDWGATAPTSRLRSTLAAPMVHRDRVLGVMTLYDQPPRAFSAEERRMLIRAAGCAAQVAHRLEAGSGPARATLTDTVTGLPNARFLQLESGQRIADEDPRGGFGLLAFRVEGLDVIGESLGGDDTDHLLAQIAGRFAAACRSRESVVRFGPDQFLVLTDLRQAGELVDRWHALAHVVSRDPFRTAVGEQSIRLVAAHATYPDDGWNFGALLAALDERLALAQRRRLVVVPFRRSSRGRGRAEPA